MQRKRRMEIKNLMQSKEGRIVISVILGFGLATIFRKVCKDNNCIVVKGPKIEDVQKYYYRIDESCYKYTPYVVDCKEKSSGGSFKV